MEIQLAVPSSRALVLNIIGKKRILNTARVSNDFSVAWGATLVLVCR
jgi:hypothetical protein